MDSDDPMAPAPFLESLTDVADGRLHPVFTVSSDEDVELAKRYRVLNSDEEEEQRARRRARKVRGREGRRAQEDGSGGVETARVDRDKVQEGARSKARTMGPPPPPPPRPQPDARQASTTKRRSPAPVASTSRLFPPQPATQATTSRTSPQAPITSRAPPNPNSRTLDTPPAQFPTMELSDSSESEIEVVQAPKRKASSKAAPKRGSSRANPKVPSARTSSAAGLPDPTSPKKGRKSGPLPPQNLEAAIKRAKVMKPAQYAEHFPTIGAYADHLNTFARKPDSILQGCRLAFVNLYDPTGKNTLDKTHLIKMSIAATKGAILVGPDEFVAAPARGGESDEEWARRAEEEDWTSHVVVTEMLGGKKAKFKDVLALLGDGGISEEEMGWAKVVRFDWVSSSSEFGERVTEWPHEPPGRPGAVVRKGVATVEEPDSADEEEGDVEMQDQDQERAISPFGADDWPVGEAPPPEYPFGDLSNAMDCDDGDASNVGKNCDANETTNSDPIEDPTLTFRSSHDDDNYDDLRKELDLVHQFGDLVSDEALDKELFDDDMIYSDIPRDDFATDEENDPRPTPKPTPKKKKRTGKTYACERKSTGGGAKSLSPNEHTASALEMLGKFTPKGSFRERGYRIAAGALRNREERITEYKDAVKIRGIGDKLAKKIVEIVRTGTHRKLKLFSERDKVIELFAGVYGIGTTKAGDYYDSGCRTLEDLDKAPGLPLTEAMELGVKYHEDLAKRIPRDEVTELYRHAVEAAKRVDPKLIVECMGSYRRGQEDCGDIDLLVTRDTSDGKDHKGLIKKLWSELSEKGIIRHSLTNPHYWKSLDVKFNGLCALPGGLMRRIDILGVPWDEMPAALIYFTGNDFFNRSMRLKARHMGFRLNQRGLYENVIRGDKGVKLTQGTKVDCPTEQAIFEKLGVTWRPATERRP